MNTTIAARHTEPFYNALIKGRRDLCREITQQCLADNTEIISIHEYLFRPCLYKLGEEWESCKISVAVEHMATSIVESLMNELLSGITLSTRNNRKAVFACVQNEEHQVGGRMVADIFEIHGWDTYFLGAKVPVQELLDFSGTVQPDILCLSLSVYFNIDMMIREIEAVRKTTDTSILIGGKKNIDLMKDNHTNHFRFIVSVLTEFNPEVLVDTVIWVFRVYKSRGFTDAYWIAQINTWISVYKTRLSGNTFSEINNLYAWLGSGIPSFSTLADRSIA